MHTTNFPVIPKFRKLLRNLKELGLGTAILSNGTPKMLEAGINNSRLEIFLDSIFLGGHYWGF